jgi:hypothetical protein
MLASVHYTDLQFLTFRWTQCTTIMNALKVITNFKTHFPEQYSNSKLSIYIKVKNVLLGIQVTRSTHPIYRLG